MAGIIRFGGYVPRRRLQRSVVYGANAWFAPGLRGLSKGERAMANWDEDSVTMAVEACRACLGDHDRFEVASLIMASTSFPYADRQNSGIVKEALALPDAIAAVDIGQSQRAGTSALIQGLHAAGAGVTTLVVGSDMRRARPASEEELINGDAAAALLLGPGPGVARLVGSYSETVDFVDHFRSADAAFDSSWESRWVREEGYQKLAGRAVEAALRHFGIDGAKVDRLIVGIAANGVATGLAKVAGIAPGAVLPNLGDRIGHPGAAQPLLLLAHALETAAPGERLLVVGFGQGVDVLLFEATADIAAAPRDCTVSAALDHGVAEENYLKFLAFTGQLGLELGKRAEFDQKPVLTALYRNRKAVMALIGGRCGKTGAVQFPRSEISVDPADPLVGTQEDHPLADRHARILTFTADNLTYTPDPPNYYGMIEFEGGGRMLAEFTDVDPELIEVGAPMRMMFRIKAEDQNSGFIKYFWKAVPAAGER